MTTLLAIGDMHLGRLPAALPEELKGRTRELGPEAAWNRAVAEAVRRRVDAVVLAGDVVERSRDFFVAYGQLKSGIEKLASAGIQVLAVAGNHDTHVLPRLADEIDSLHLLGRGGRWERRRVGEATLIGWSFPQSQVRSSPLDSFPARQPGETLIGVLHCDRDQTDSPYAPVSSGALDSAPVSAWLLGHIHQPDPLDGDRPIGYLGSVNALRASECGPRGPWLVNVGKRRVEARQLALAPLRFDSLDVDCSELESTDQLGAEILAATRAYIDARQQRDLLPDALGLRIELTGHSRVSDRLSPAADSLLDEARPWTESGVVCFIHRISVNTLPALDLEPLARQSDPAGLLARRLQALEAPDSPERSRLIELGREQLLPTVESREFRDLGRCLSDDDILGLLKRSGRIALSRLLAQRNDRR